MLTKKVYRLTVQISVEAVSVHPIMLHVYLPNQAAFRRARFFTIKGKGNKTSS